MHQENEWKMTSLEENEWKIKELSDKPLIIEPHRLWWVEF